LDDDLVGMVLCAGLGTRLRPLTERVPKPAVPVCGLPLVRYALALLAGAGVRRAVVNVHHLPDVMASVAEAAARAVGLELTVSREPIIAGTGGALREARRALEGANAIAVVNGDVLFDLDLRRAVADHRRSGALATMVLAPMPAGGRYAAVEADAGGAVRRIAGRFGPGGEALTPWHFTGVHVVAPALLDRVPGEPFELDVNRHVYPLLMAEGLVRAHVAGGYWNDLGAPERYLAANRDLLAGRVPLDRFPGADPYAGLDRRGPGVHVARSARVEPGAALHPPVLVCDGASISAGAVAGPEAVVGPRCRVAAGARVARAVLWEGASLAPGEEVVESIADRRCRVSAPGL
jgi:mannose-1-phosphate guanylyltransferase